MISYLGLLVQFSPAAGRVGRYRQLLLCMGSIRRAPPRQPEVLAASPRVLRAFSLRGERPGQPEVCEESPRARRAARAARGLVPFPLARCAFSLRGVLPGQPEAWVHSLRLWRAFSLRGPSARRRSGLRKSLDRNRGLLAGGEGVASLGLSFPLAPPPASFLQRGWGGSSLEFLSPFVLRTAGGVFQPVNFSSLSHSLKKASLRLLSGPSGRSSP